MIRKSLHGRRRLPFSRQPITHPKSLSTGLFREYNLVYLCTRMSKDGAGVRKAIFVALFLSRFKDIRNCNAKIAILPIHTFSLALRTVVMFPRLNSTALNMVTLKVESICMKYAWPKPIRLEKALPSPN